MRILYLQGGRFVRALRDRGHEVVTAGEQHWLDHVLTGEQFSVREAVHRMGGEPDAILLELFGRRPFVRGLEETDLPILAYVIDAPLNLYWLRHHLRLVDRALIDQKPGADALRGEGIDARWFPLSVDEHNLAGLKPKQTPGSGIVFVGRFTESRPRRRWLVNYLAEQVPVHLAGGDRDAFLQPRDVYHLYADSKIVLNENLFDGWTMRAFEAMGAGSLLLTERVSETGGELFRDGTHLVAFDPATLVEKARRYLSDDTARRRIAEAGRAEVLAKHTHAVRAAEIEQHLSDLTGGERVEAELPDRQVHAAEAWRMAALRWPDMAADLVPRAIRAAEAAKRAGRDVERTLGLLHGQWTQKLEPARSHLSAAVRRHPGEGGAAVALGEHLRRHGEEQAAGDVLASWLERDGVPEANLAAELRQGRFSAKGWSAVADRLRDVGRATERGFAKFVEDRLPNTALDFYRRAFDEGDATAGWRGAEILAEQGSWADAYLLGVRALEGALTPERLFRVSLWGLRCYRIEEAAGLLNQALDLDPALRSRLHKAPLPPEWRPLAAR